MTDCGCAEREVLVARAQRGAEVLDRVYGPDWDRGINLGSLDLASVAFCVLGQVGGHYITGLTRLSTFTGRVIFEEPASWGFNAENGCVSEYRVLTEVWRELIQQKRLDRVPVVQTNPRESALV